MTPLGLFVAALQLVSSWLMSVLALLALLLSVIVCVFLVEVIFDRNAIAQAYTVKARWFDNNNSSTPANHENPL